MRVLIVGDWHSELHEEVVYQALLQLGHEPCRFAWHYYFKPKSRLGKLNIPLLKAQNRYMIGPLVNKLNRDLLAKVVDEQSDLVFVYRGSHVYPDTLRKIRRLAPYTVLAGYNNDDPFSPYYPKWKWRHFLAGVPEYDIVFAYRLHNLAEFKSAGAKRVELLRSWFVPERNYPVELTNEEKDKFACDVVFVGHYEDDGRLEYLEEIARCGWNLRIFGPGYEWNDVLHRSDLLRRNVPVKLVWGRDYNLSLCGAKIALCFLSKLNRDTYTRRCFEIPATGTVLLSEYSSDLESLFKHGDEAFFFKNVQQMREEIENLLADESMRQQVARAGRCRVWNDGHDVVSRMENVMTILDEIARS